MASDNRKYRTSGSAAYDVYSVRFDPNAALERPSNLPEERKEPQKQKVEKAKLVIAPFAAVGMLVVVALLAMVVYGYVQYYEASSRVGELNSQLTHELQENTKLRSSYESKIDLKQIEVQARELGMRQPTARQTVYLNIPGADHTEVLEVDNRSFLQKTWDAIRDSFTGIVEYFRK